VKRKVLASLLSVSVLLSILMAGVHAVNSFTDWRLSPVTTNAMSPDISTGSLLVSVLTPENQIRSGDVVVLGTSDEKRNLIGRVLDINTDDNEYYNISLKSDQRALPDNFPYKTKDITYKEQFTVPLVGFIVNFLSSPLGLILLTLFTIVISYVYLYRYHARLTWEQRSVKRITRARKKAQERIAERGEHNGVEEMKAFFAESAV
jgi:signal peptidase I